MSRNYDETRPRMQNTPENLIFGRNPVMEALKSGREIEKILMAKGDMNGSMHEILARARARLIPVQEVDRQKIDGMAQGHQGVCAYVSAAKYYSVDEIIAGARDSGQEPLLVLLDGITDPQNTGAIARSAECAGAHGVVFPSRRSAGLTPVSAKAAAGAFEYIKPARVTNLARTIDELKEMGVWVFGADMQGEDYRSVDFSGPLAIVIGAEGDGLSRLVREKCDRLVSLPVVGKIDSLNASCAAALLLYEALRARDKQKE
ncbi:MAG: 23S rRNA (guanosine(2251)-2'-O)-methyltransferase RlmB [Christensenellales bacterium]|jgi:23S rRNA (guanosine2251-2'-O)-methyltransferase